MNLLKSKSFYNYYGETSDDYYLKFIHHNIIVFDDSEEEYKKLSEDFKEIYSLDNEVFIIYFSDIENYVKVIQNIDIPKEYEDKIYLRIRNKDEYNQLIQYGNNELLKLVIDISDIETLDIKDFKIVVQIDTVKELPIYKLNQLLSKYDIKEVLMGQIPYLTKNDRYLYDIMSEMYNIDSSKKLELEKINKITNDIYSINTYKKIVDKFTEIIKQLDVFESVEGFYKIFQYIAENVIYDDDGVTKTKIEDQNLIGPVLYGKSVCEGYSKFLQQMLSLINIESIVVQGGGNKESGGHVWNQVLINDKWYNADVTVASINIHNNEDVKTCLVKDDNLLYKTNTSVSYICDKDYESYFENDKVHNR